MYKIILTLFLTKVQLHTGYVYEKGYGPSLLLLWQDENSDQASL